MAVAGRLNREYAERLQPEYRPISIECWPSGTTSEGLDQEGGYGIPPPPPPPPPPPAPMAERSEAIVVTGSRIMAQREDLGDLKLYRIPIPVTVAAHSQKQVALLEQPQARVADLFRWDTSFENDADEPQAARRLLKMDNRKANGLGLPLPAGSFTLYTMRDGRPFLLGEGQMSDRAIGEIVEVDLSDAPGVRVSQRQMERKGKDRETVVTVTNDQAVPARFEARFGDETKPIGGAVKRRDGYWVWEVLVPANSTRTLTLRYRPD
jgi:hypothetical protein